MKRLGPVLGIIAAVAAAAAAVAALILLSPKDREPHGKVTSTDSAAKPKLHEHHGEVMRTGFAAKAVFAGRTEAGAREDLAATFGAARRVEKLMSRFLPESDVSRLAAAKPGTPVTVDPWTFEVLALSKDIHRRSSGAFDVTVGPLVKLYKYAGREERRPPTDAEIAKVLRRVGSDKLKLNRKKGTAALAAPGMTVDLSAVAKGFAVDQALEALRERGARGALVEIGGEVRGFGTKPGGEKWRIGLQHPRAARLMAVLEVDDRAVATSGDYQKFFKRGGRRASHIIDARTGKPLVGGAVGVTVIAPTCALADGLATAISVLGPAEGLKLVESYPDVEAVIIEEGEGGALAAHLSSGLKDKLKLVDLSLPAKQ